MIDFADVGTSGAARAWGFHDPSVPPPGVSVNTAWGTDGRAWYEAAA